ncbi:MAG: DNA recombination protein RmuC [Chloroflexi bacterium]|nr:DNA recombination protein RmuC [Chloroflexota bacterium]
MDMILALLAGLVIGGLTVFLLARWQNKAMEKTFSALSLEALRKNTEDFLRLANESLSKHTQAGSSELEGKKKLIDQTLEAMKADLQKVERLVTDIDSKREKSFGEVSTHLKLVGEQTGKLQETTGKLQAALANTRVRGQWGERMAEDVVRTIGLVEHIDYERQKQQETGDSRPDYTFLLPHDLKVNMDVKFPLNNYLKFASEESEDARQKHKAEFLKDARKRIKEVTTREYINPEGRTVDYVLVFVPNEQIYCFIHENDGSILDDALKSKVVLCSPLTLYAILAVMRQAIDTFNLEKATTEVLSLYGAFNLQWAKFQECLEGMGRHIDQTRQAYDSLVSTRRAKLDTHLRKIDDLIKQRGIALPADTTPRDGNPDL